MNGEIDKSISQQALEKWGFDEQLNMIEEECLELALAIQKLKREFSQPRFEAVVDEIADVKIVLASAELMFPIGSINERVDFKMNRLVERIKNNTP